MKSKIYIIIDEQNRIVADELEELVTVKTINEEGEEMLQVADGWFCITPQEVEMPYFPKSIMTMDGIPTFKYINGEVVERNEEEIEQDRNNVPTPEPSAEEVRFTEIEDALIEVSEMVVENEMDTTALAEQIAEIQDALVELAEMITGE